MSCPGVSRHLCVCLSILCCDAILQGQAPPRVFVGDFGASQESSAVRSELAARLKKSGAFVVVSSPSQADEVLTGDTQLSIKGYVSLYQRAGTSPSHGMPVYNGYVSVELKNRNGETLWSNLSSLRAGTKDAPRQLARDILRHLVAARLETGTAKP